ncbi:MAG TPA: hypothetical protein VLG46_17390, partial [Anaerolineae bacterium]|nr:hypothetical protein [Anaerolineae bacterium]
SWEIRDMSRKWLSLVMSGLAVIALAIATNVSMSNTLVARADQGSAPTVISEEADQNRREIQAAGEAPDISFIDSPGATCYRASVGVCYLQWSYLSVSASTSQYIISMTVSIDGRLRSYHSGFFQTSMYIPYDMLKPGFKVACGWRGASGAPGLGYSYDYVISAAETGGLKAANYGTVTCPADAGTVFLPILSRR